MDGVKRALGLAALAMGFSPAVSAQQPPATPQAPAQSPAQPPTQSPVQSPVQAQEGVFVSTPDGRVVDCNDAFVNLLGYDSRDEVLAKDIAQSYYAFPSDRNVFLQKMSKQGVLKNFEVTLRRKDGSLVTVLENSYATKTQSGNIIRYHGVRTRSLLTTQTAAPTR